MKFFILLFFIFYPLIVYSDQENALSYAAIAARLAPDGGVNIAGQSTFIEASTPDAARPERGGNEIFNQYCIVCHGTGVAGSPKFGCASSWNKRKEKGFAVLLNHATNGFHFMPAQGTCLDCSQGELEEAIHYMINHSIKDDAAC